MAKYIGILGSCATGKSTRVNKLVDHLGNDYDPISYAFSKNDNDYDLPCGRLYPNGLFIAGNKTKAGNWVGADGIFGKLGSKDLILEFIDIILLEADTFLVEGYFAVGGSFLRPESMSKYVDTFNQYYFLYDELGEYVERTEARTGNSWESRGKDPEQSAGWKSNKSFHSGMSKSKDELIASGMTGQIHQLCKDTDINYFIERYEQGVL